MMEDREHYKWPADIIGDKNLNDLKEVVTYLEGLRGNDNHNVSDAPSLFVHECPTCKTKVMENLHNMIKHSLFGELSSHTNPNHFIVCLNCPNCQKDICVRVCGQWYSIEDMMRSEKYPSCSCKQVATPVDRLILYLLNQVIYKQYEFCEGQQIFLPTPPDEHARILCADGQAIGFYTVKPKGSVYSKYDWHGYTLPVLDLIYVREKYRRCGWASFMLEDFISYNLGQFLGISAPISQDMYKVLFKFLSKHEDLRDYLWECTYTGAEGYRKNIWLYLCSHNLKQEDQNPPVGLGDPPQSETSASQTSINKH